MVVAGGGGGGGGLSGLAGGPRSSSAYPASPVRPVATPMPTTTRAATIGVPSPVTLSAAPVGITAPGQISPALSHTSTTNKEQQQQQQQHVRSESFGLGGAMRSRFDSASSVGPAATGMGLPSSRPGRSPSMSAATQASANGRPVATTGNAGPPPSSSSSASATASRNGPAAYSAAMYPTFGYGLAAIDREGQRERDRERELAAQRDRERDIMRAVDRSRDRQREIDTQARDREREREREREKMREADRARERERDMELQREKVAVDRERERARLAQTQAEERKRMEERERDYRASLRAREERERDLARAQPPSSTSYGGLFGSAYGRNTGSFLEREKERERERERERELDRQRERDSLYGRSADRQREMGGSSYGLDRRPPSLAQQAAGGANPNDPGSSRAKQTIEVLNKPGQTPSSSFTGSREDMVYERDRTTSGGDSYLNRDPRSLGFASTQPSPQKRLDDGISRRDPYSPGHDRSGSLSKAARGRLDHAADQAEQAHRRQTGIGLPSSSQMGKTGSAGSASAAASSAHKRKRSEIFSMGGGRDDEMPMHPAQQQKMEEVAPSQSQSRKRTKQHVAHPGQQMLPQAQMVPIYDYKALTIPTPIDLDVRISTGRGSSPCAWHAGAEAISRAFHLPRCVMVAGRGTAGIRGRSNRGH